MAGNSRVIIDNTSTIGDIVSTELPAIMTRLQTWWTTWDEIHESKLTFLAWSTPIIWINSDLNKT
jgi:hypothetical protein